jgi:hypothetical protein
MIMKRIPVFFALMLSLAATAHVRAEEKFDPAARAKAIAPFLDENVAAVVHVDLTRIKFDLLWNEIVKFNLLPDCPDTQDPDLIKNKGKQQIDALIKAGVTDAYGIFTPTLDYYHRFLILTASPNVDEKAVKAVFHPTPLLRIGNTLILGAEDQLDRVIKITPDPRPELETALEAAGDTAVQIVITPPKHYRRVIEETMPQLPKEIGGGESTILTRGILWGAVGIDLPPKMSIRVVVQSQDAAAATALRAKMTEIVKIASAWWMAKEYTPRLLEMSAQLLPEVEGNRLVLSLDNREGKIGKILEDLGSILEKERESTRSAMSRENLKEIGLAMHNYCDVHKHFPPPAIYSKDGKPLLSWRIAILPQLGLNEIYNKFHLDEPWDSPHNLELSKIPIAVYSMPMTKTSMTPDKKSFLIKYLVPVGPGTAFDTKEGMKIEDIKDGTADTILAVEVDNEQAVVWTKPDDLSYDPQEPAKGLSKKYAFYALFCDGHITPIRSSSSAEELRAWFSTAGGEKAKSP